MSLDVFLQNAEGGDASFGIDLARYQRMQINSVNRTARWARRVLMVEPFSKATGVRRAIFNDRLTLRQATNNTPVASITPSSRGIPARSYKHRGDPINGSKLRARVLVAWWRGEKVAAGFINPSSSRKLPLATRSVAQRTSRAGKAKTYQYNYEVPRTAQGPSAAALFQVAVDDSVMQQVDERLGIEFNIDLDKELF
jgi:hypothetical protein